jgi:FAD/FMN-containing dehydrogenase/Fe-S oxidoreductase
MATTTLIPAATLRREARPQVDTRSLEHDLRRAVEGEVRFDAGSRAMYATDASNYRQVPIGVVVPRSIEDVVLTVAACRAHAAPILSRAGGTSLAGQTCNRAVVIDCSKYLRRIVSIDPAGRYAHVEPGVVCDDVVRATAPYDLTWAPQPSAHAQCCFGGMLGNNSCGIHAQMGGKAVDNTEELDVLLYDGTRMHVGWMREDDFDASIRVGGRVGDVYAKLRALRTVYADEIRARFPRLPRRVSGYNLDQLLPGDDGRFNVARSLVGSEGTCVTILGAKVRLVYSPPARVLVIVGYPDVFHAADHVPEILEFHPTGLEGIDDGLRRRVMIKGGPHRDVLALLPRGGGWLLVELGGRTPDEARDAAQRVVARLERVRERPVDVKIVDDPREQKLLWTMRESGLGATAFVPGYRDAWEGWADSAVRPELLGQYLRDLHALLRAYGYDTALYGHFGMGCVHARIDFDLYTHEGVARFRGFVSEASDLVVRYGGSLSGEHGDGQSKAEFLSKMFGLTLVRAFRDYKAIWDPDGKMNPGKIVDPYRVDENLRFGKTYNPWEPETHFKWPDDYGSFAHAARRCVGIGKCRRTSGEGEGDVMCPSYMVTREEKHTTRGRAHLLHEMLVRGPIDGAWRDENVKEALDLCLSCKGCKSDCPVNVDVATYKAEFLAHYYEGRLRPRAAYAFGLVDRWARLASFAPGLVNLATQMPLLAPMAKLLAGVSRERKLPAFAPETFRAWFARRPARGSRGRRVVLWPDTFNDCFSPEVAKDAVDVLEHAGFSVEVPAMRACCGRPLYDYGMLNRAKRYLERVFVVLRPALEAGTKVVMLEPSCASVFRDEARGLFPNRHEARLLAERTVLLSELLDDDALAYVPPRLARRAIVQGHCHHKSVLRFDAEKRLLTKMGIELELLESGCCGMAGAFGYEKDKHAVSMAAGERVLLPAVRAASTDAIVMADGFSCREQIAQGTRRHALHLAQVMKLALGAANAAPVVGQGAANAVPVERKGSAVDAPESPIVAERKRAQRRSMARAVLALAALAAALAAWRLLRHRTNV